MNKIIIETRGGVIQCVTALEDLQMIFVDHDDDQEDKIRKAKDVYSPDSICDEEQFQELLKEVLINESEDSKICAACDKPILKDGKECHLKPNTYHSGNCWNNHLGECIEEN